MGLILIFWRWALLKQALLPQSMMVLLEVDILCLSSKLWWGSQGLRDHPQLFLPGQSVLGYSVTQAITICCPSNLLPLLSSWNPLLTISGWHPKWILSGLQTDGRNMQYLLPVRLPEGLKKSNFNRSSDRSPCGKPFFFNVQLTSSEKGVGSRVFYEQVLENFQVTILMFIKLFQDYRMMKHFPNYFSKLIKPSKQRQHAKKELFYLL